jgi:CBS domain-containing protein
MVEDIICEPPIIYHDSSLLDVIQKMDQTGDETFFVVDKRDPQRLVGVVTRHDIIRIYSKEIE